MKEEEYIQCQSSLILLAKIVKDLPLNEFLSAIDHANTVGPLLDPTLWMRGSKKMQEIRQLASSLLPFQAEIYKQLKSYDPEHDPFNSTRETFDGRYSV